MPKKNQQELNELEIDEKIFDKFIKPGNKQSFTFGIDEAGRGPVCGPLVYAICVCESSLIDNAEFWKLIGAHDSKKLTPFQRAIIYKKMKIAEQKNLLYLRYEEISPKDISIAMLSPVKISLNTCSYNAAAKLVNDACNYIKEKYGDNAKMLFGFCDIITPAWRYEEIIRNNSNLLPGNCKITITESADAIYPIVGAASIVAKEQRDLKIESGWGSGYPNPETVKYIKTVYKEIFGFPNNIRWSWSTIENLYNEKNKDQNGYSCCWVRDQNWILKYTKDEKKDLTVQNKKLKNQFEQQTGLKDMGCIKYPLNKTLYF